MLLLKLHNFARHPYCKHSFTTSTMQICFPWVCSPFLISTLIFLFSFTNLPLFKDVEKNKTHTPLQKQHCPTSSPLRSMTTSFPFSAHTFKIWTTKGECLPTLADQVRRTGWCSATQLECLLAAVPTAGPNKL